MSEYQRVTQMRRDWAPQDSDDDGPTILTFPTTLCVDDQLSAPLTPHPIAMSESPSGVRYQRCGGGFRVLRKRVGGD